jgi:hypothetical protein
MAAIAKRAPLCRKKSSCQGWTYLAWFDAAAEPAE